MVMLLLRQGRSRRRLVPCRLRSARFPVRSSLSIMRSRGFAAPQRRASLSGGFNRLGLRAQAPRLTKPSGYTSPRRIQSREPFASCGGSTAPRFSGARREGQSLLRLPPRHPGAISGMGSFRLPCSLRHPYHTTRPRESQALF